MCPRLMISDGDSGSESDTTPAKAEEDAAQGMRPVATRLSSWEPDVDPKQMRGLCLTLESTTTTLVELVGKQGPEPNRRCSTA